MSNQEAIALLRNLEDSLDAYCELNDEGKTAFGVAITALELLGISEQLPSAQPEIIRCKDCLMHGVCRFERGLGLDGYCSQAERRTDDRSD